jgi:hypothetical protein
MNSVVCPHNNDLLSMTFNKHEAYELIYRIHKTGIASESWICSNFLSHMVARYNTDVGTVVNEMENQHSPEESEFSFRMQAHTTVDAGPIEPDTRRRWESEEIDIPATWGRVRTGGPNAGDDSG